MNFLEVAQACLEFSSENDATIQSYPANQPDRLQVQARTNRTAIFVERGPGEGEWRLEQLKNAAGKKTGVSAMVTTVDGLQAQLQTLWDN